jgi:hypothetical protein
MWLLFCLGQRRHRLVMHQHCTSVQLASIPEFRGVSVAEIPESRFRVHPPEAAAPASRESTSGGSGTIGGRFCRFDVLLDFKPERVVPWRDEQARRPTVFCDRRTVPNAATRTAIGHARMPRRSAGFLVAPLSSPRIHGVHPDWPLIPMIPSHELLYNGDLRTNCATLGHEHASGHGCSPSTGVCV